MQKFADISIKTTTKVIKLILALPVTTVSSIQPLISTKCDTFGHIIHDDNDQKTPVKVSQTHFISAPVLINIHMLGIKLHHF